MRGPDLIHYGQPVNWRHPLNRGLAGWWLTLPWWRGGIRWHDLCRKSHGTLTNGPKWANPRGRPGGRGGVEFDGVDDRVNAVTNLGLGNANVTLACWAYLTDASRKGTFIKVGGSSSGYSVGVGSGTHDAAGNELIALYEGIRWVASGVLMGTGWHHATLTIDGSGVPSLHLDGRLLASYAGGGAGTPSANTDLGGHNPNGSTPRFFAGLLDDVRAYRRTLTASEVWQLYDLSRRGDPGVLSRIARHSRAAPVSVVFVGAGIIATSGVSPTDSSAGSVSRVPGVGSVSGSVVSSFVSPIGTAPASPSAKDVVVSTSLLLGMGQGIGIETSGTAFASVSSIPLVYIPPQTALQGVVSVQVTVDGPTASWIVHGPLWGQEGGVWVNGAEAGGIWSDLATGSTSITMVGGVWVDGVDAGGILTG